MQKSGHRASDDKMLSFAPTPIFTGAWDHRPCVSSPLSSSPIRASSPLSPINQNNLPQRQVQSSPIQPPKFKFASRPTRPNPVVRRREDAQESRRKLFLQNVRQKSDDKAWQRRDIEGQFLKINWLANQGQLTHDAPDFSEADIEDAMAFQEEQSQPQDDDDMMLDDIPEEDDFEAMFATYEEQRSVESRRPPSLSLSDEDYDDIFAELISQEESQQEYSVDQMDITDGDNTMSS